MTYYDPTERRNKWRWDVAHWLNKVPGTCWANLVSWALGSGRLLDLRDGYDARQDSTCRRDAEACGRCYCGRLTAAPPPAREAETSAATVRGEEAR